MHRQLYPKQLKPDHQMSCLPKRDIDPLQTVPATQRSATETEGVHQPVQLQVHPIARRTKRPIQILRALGEFGNTLKNLPILFTSSGLQYLLGDSRLKYVILYAIYTFSPIDLLPEAFLGPIGLLDDGMVVAGMIRQISSILYGFVREEALRQ